MSITKVSGMRSLTNHDNANNAAEVEMTAGSAVSDSVGVPLMLLGPTFTALATIANRHAQLFSPPGALQIALCFIVGGLWSPFSVSIPSAILQFAKDSALPMWGATSTWNPMNIVRLVVLTPYLMFSRHSAVRAQMIAAVIGWLAGLAIVVAQLH